MYMSEADVGYLLQSPLYFIPSSMTGLSLNLSLICLVWLVRRTGLPMSILLSTVVTVSLMKVKCYWWAGIPDSV